MNQYFLRNKFKTICQIRDKGSFQGNCTEMGMKNSSEWIIIIGSIQYSVQWATDLFCVYVIQCALIIADKGAVSVSIKANV